MQCTGLVHDPRTVQLRIPFATLIKVALFLLLVQLLTRLLPILIAVAFAIQIAIVLTPLHEWMKRRIPAALSMSLIAALLLGLLVTVVGVVIPQTAKELTSLVKQLPQISQRVSERAPGLSPYLDAISAEVARPAHPQKVKQWVTRGLVVGEYILGGLTTVLFVLVLALYLMAEGRQALAWLFSFAPEPQRERLARSVSEVRPVVLAYMKGQLITGTASFLVSFAVLAAFRVPAALPLALLAFIGDFVPVVGFIVATVPAVALAMLRGPTAALTVLAVYLLYQAIENWVLGPRVYGKQMQLSTLTVLLAVAVGGIFGGPLGAILMLPAAAAYPVLERIWLRERLVPGTVEKHDALEEGSEMERERTIDEMLSKEGSEE